MSLAVVILNWNGADDTLACLASLRAQTRPPEELVVIDNGSEDDSVTRLEEVLGDELVVSKVNLGFAAGVNLGIGRTRAEWVLLLNNDTTLPPDALQQLSTRAKRAAPNVGMLQPVLVFRDRPGFVNSSGVALRPQADATDRDFERPLDGPTHLDEEPFAVTAGAGLYRRALLDAIALPDGAPFDATHFMYFEDVDVGWRARLAGWSAQVVPEVRVAHGFRASSKKRPEAFVNRLCRLNRTRMLLKNASWGTIFRVLLSPRPRRDLGWMLQEDGWSGIVAYVKAIRDGLRFRRAVSRSARHSRSEIERRWVERS